MLTFFSYVLIFNYFFLKGPFRPFLLQIHKKIRFRHRKRVNIIHLKKRKHLVEFAILMDESVYFLLQRFYKPALTSGRRREQIKCPISVRECVLFCTIVTHKGHDVDLTLKVAAEALRPMRRLTGERGPEADRF